MPIQHPEAVEKFWHHVGEMQRMEGQRTGAKLREDTPLGEAARHHALLALAYKAIMD